MARKPVKILVTGASGYVGARLYRDLSHHFTVFGTCHNTRLFPELFEVDLTDRRRALALVEKLRPDVIVHAAALSSPRFCRGREREARAVNVGGTRNVVSAANRVGARVIYVSTTAASAPHEAYGRTKLQGEFEAMKAKAGFLILRPSIIIGQSPNTANDRMHNRLLQNISAGEPAVYEGGAKFQPTWAGHLSQVIRAAVEGEIYGDIIPVVVPERKTRLQLAADVLKNFGITPSAAEARESGPPERGGTRKLRKHGLPIYSYGDVTENTSREIREWLSIKPPWRGYGRRSSK